ncbi:MAG: tetratricopeptide repeat protein, partial [Synechococcus sp. SB0670_bin_20]|nr:tetratricopeptide repeat protein [Synechococcus sp. SB0670_bin_20]
QLGKPQEGIAYYKKALAIDPNHLKALTNLGAALVQLGKLQESINYSKKALAINPNWPAALTNLGTALVQLGKIQESIAYYKKALAIDPDSPRSLANLGVALILSGELQEASNTCRKAISLRPDYIPAHWSLSFSLLSSGDYENGWKEYEWRFRVEDTLHAHLPQLKKWNGSSHCSRDNLVLVSEQGFGDIMQFMRYILYLRKRGMIVAFCTRTKLHGLIQSSGITSEIYSPEEVHQLTTREWLPLLSLPMHLKVRPDNPLIQEPYIKAPAERILYWKQKLSSEKRPIIGINWQGNASTEIHMLRGRSLPLETFTPLTENIDASFLSLQKGDGSEQLTDCKFLDRFVDCQEEINQTWDFVENAAIIMNCDLIITMDTSVAHLAGGLGKTTWLLLHKPCDWRWGMEGDTTFWYPSMRLFRQRERGNWQEVMDRVAMALQGAYSQRFIQAAR